MLELLAVPCGAMRCHWGHVWVYPSQHLLSQYGFNQIDGASRREASHQDGYWLTVSIQVSQFRLASRDQIGRKNIHLEPQHGADVALFESQNQR